METGIYKLIFAGLACIVGASVLHAFSPSEPAPHDVFSANGKFVLALDPKEESQPVFAVDNRTTPLWLVQSGLWQEEFYLSNDGTVVVEVSWEFTSTKAYESSAVRFHNADGVFQAYKYSELCPDPYTTIDVPGPVGDEWRRWLWVQSVEDGDLLVHTVDGHIHHFSMNTGERLRTARGDSMPTLNATWKKYFILLAGAALACIVALGIVFRGRRRIVHQLSSPESNSSS